MDQLASLGVAAQVGLGHSNLRLRAEKALWLRMFEGHGEIIKHRGAGAEAARPAGMCAVIHLIGVLPLVRGQFGVSMRL